MRALGTELGVEAMSLYKHVPNKDAILDGMVQQAFNEVDWEAGARGSWKRRIETAALGFLAIGRAHPQIFPMLLSRQPAGPSGDIDVAVLRPIEAMLSALDAAGLKRAEAVSVFWTLLSYIYGAVICDLAQSGDADAQVLPMADLEAAEGFPFTQAAAANLARCDLGDEFLAGVRRIIAGSV